MTPTREPSVLIAELHAAGYSNAKIGYLLPQYGGEEVSEAAVRAWAMRQRRCKQTQALAALHDDVFAHLCDRSPAECPG